MKLGDRYKVDGLASRRIALIDAVEILAKPVAEQGSGFGITIRGTYQSQPLLEACRPAVLAVFRAELLAIEEELRQLGVEVED